MLSWPFMGSAEFCLRLEQIATKKDTLYVYGGFGAPMTAENKKRYKDSCEFNRRPERQAKIEAASADTFAFDCSGLIKGIAWGWYGNTKAKYGGARYESNGLEDIGAATIIKRCKGVSSDFRSIQRGEAVYKPGHIGVYVGHGMVIECSPIWQDGVQFSTLIPGQFQHYREWTQHGRLPWILYSGRPENGLRR